VQYTAQLITALLALGMALAFIVADRRSPTSRALSAFLAWVGISIATFVLILVPLRAAHGITIWDGFFAIPETLAFYYAYEWVLRVRRTVPAGTLNTKGADRFLRVAQGLAIFYCVAAIAAPELRAEQFLNAGLTAILRRMGPELFLFGMPLALSLLLGIAAGLLMLRRRPDRAESQRAIAFVIAAPFMASGMVLPPDIAPLTTTLGLLILLVGAVQFHVVQGRRAQFMSRFLSPQVAEMVRVRGLRSATEHKTLEISVVCCDLRGFTAFSKSTPSDKVIHILREYYDAVGAIAAEFGGTIKDQAGDGVLILIGAPVSFDDHAERALQMANRIREAGLRITASWSGGDLQLGMGAGVASGYVTVGVIGAASRLEYTAVGPAVNLASRLCSEAAHGEVLVDKRTLELLGPDGAGMLREHAQLSLKGYDQPVASYALAGA
jgi:adenylate cyclase